MKKGSNQICDYCGWHKALYKSKWMIKKIGTNLGINYSHVNRHLKLCEKCKNILINDNRIKKSELEKIGNIE